MLLGNTDPEKPHMVDKVFMKVALAREDQANVVGVSEYRDAKESPRQATPIGHDSDSPTSPTLEVSAQPKNLKVPRIGMTSVGDDIYRRTLVRPKTVGSLRSCYSRSIVRGKRIKLVVAMRISWGNQTSNLVIVQSSPHKNLQKWLPQ